MDFTQYVVPGVAIAVYIICAIIKPFIGEKSKFLPIIAGIVGVGLEFWTTGDLSFATFLAGLVSGFGATGIDQLVSIPITKKTENNEPVE